MKLSTETKEDLILCIDARLQQIKDSVQSDFIKESELIDIIKEYGGDKLAKNFI